MICEIRFKPNEVGLQSLASKRDAARRSYLTGEGRAGERRAARSKFIFLRSSDIVGSAFVPNPRWTPQPAHGCCCVRPGLTSVDSLRSTSHHEDSRASGGGTGGQSCSSGQVQLPQTRVVGRGGRWDYVEAATDRLLSTVQQRSRRFKEVHSDSATANSGTRSPQSPRGERVFLVSVGPKVSRL